MQIKVIALLFFCVLVGGCSGEATSPGIASGYMCVGGDHDIGSLGRETSVVYFFKYSCPQCYRFHSSLTMWAAKFPDSRRDALTPTVVPVVFDDTSETEARLHFALEGLATSEEAYEVLFDVFQSRPYPMDASSRVAAALLTHKGTQTIQEAMYSDDVSRKVDLARSATRSLPVRSVPALLIRGKYLIDTQTASRPDTMLRVAESLLENNETSGSGELDNCGRARDANEGGGG